MKIDYSRSFGKQYKKLPKKIQKKFDERVVLFLKEPENPLWKVPQN